MWTIFHYLYPENFSDMSHDRFIELIKQWNHVQDEKKSYLSKEAFLFYQLLISPLEEKSDLKIWITSL